MVIKETPLGMKGRLGGLSFLVKLYLVRKYD